jgi:hypothetical protein
MKKLFLTVIFAVLMTMPGFAATHYFVDGIIPEGMEFSIGYVDIDEDASWIDVYFIPMRLEAAFGDNVSIFGELQYNDYDYESTFSIGGGAMMQIIEDGPTVPFNVALRGALFYGFEKEESGWTVIPSVFSVEGRAIISKQFDHAVNWTPYGNLVLQYSKYDSDWGNDSDTYFDFVLGVKLRFEQFALFAEKVFGDGDAIGIGGSFTF